MPSHRKERVPRRGAQRRTENPSRRAWLHAEQPAPDPPDKPPQAVVNTPQPVTGSSQPALETSWSAFLATAEADLSPTVPIMLTAPGMLPSVSDPDLGRIAPHDAALDRTVIGGTAPHDAAFEGTVLRGPSVGGPSVGGSSVA